MIDYEQIAKLGPVDRWRLLLQDVWPSIALLVVVALAAFAFHS